MARFRNGAKYGMTAVEVNVARLLIQGKSSNEIYHAIYGMPEHPTKAEHDRAYRKLRKVLDHPHFKDLYNDILKEYMIPAFSNATQRLTKQIDDPNGWLANKASNDIINQFKDKVMGADSTEVVVRVEGMPALGTPEEADE